MQIRFITPLGLYHLACDIQVIVYNLKIQSTPVLSILVIVALVTGTTETRVFPPQVCVHSYT